MTFELAVILILIAGFSLLAFLVWRGRPHLQPQEDFFNKIERQIGDFNKYVLEQLNARFREHGDSFQNVNTRFQSFASEVGKLSEVVRQVQNSMKEVSSFQQILQAPKLRGRWGELSLEHHLAQYFPRDTYLLQHQFQSGDQVDAALKLPNNKLLPIDAKFPLDDFNRMVEARSDTERLAHARSFAAVCRKEIDDISRKYILPGEGTTSFAIMYVPAEAVYYEIAHRMPEEDLLTYARRKQIVVTSPNNLFLMIQVIQQWAKDIQISKQTQEILKRLGRIATDGKKLSEGFQKLGKHIHDAVGAHESNQKRLSLLVDRVERIAEVAPPEEPEALESPPVEARE